MVDATQVRAKAASLPMSLRGFDKQEVMSYLGRVALAVEALGATDSLSDLPPELTPQAIRQQDFTLAWRGYNRVQVGVYLAEIADGIELQHSNSLGQ